MGILLIVNSVGNYCVYVLNIVFFCVDISQVKVIVVYLNLVVNVGIDQVVCVGMVVIFFGFGVIFYSWNNGVFNGIFFILFVIVIYIVIGIDVNGCQNSDVVVVIVNVFFVVNVGMD